MESKPSGDGGAASEQKPEEQATPKPRTAEEILAEIETKVEKIEKHLHHLDRRDYWRMWGGAFRTFVHFLPTILIILGIWFFYYYGDDLLKYIAGAVAKQSVQMLQNQGSAAVESGNDLLKGITDYFSGG